MVSLQKPLFGAGPELQGVARSANRAWPQIGQKQKRAKIAPLIRGIVGTFSPDLRERRKREIEISGPAQALYESLGTPGGLISKAGKLEIPRGF